MRRSTRHSQPPAFRIGAILQTATPGTGQGPAQGDAPLLAADAALYWGKRHGRMEDVEQLNRALQAIRRTGVSIAADDVGAGNAGLQLRSRVETPSQPYALQQVGIAVGLGCLLGTPRERPLADDLDLDALLARADPLLDAASRASVQAA